MKLLYVSRDRTGHDERFISAWTAAGAEVVSLAASDSSAGAASSHFEERVHAAVSDFEPDVVQAGPVTDVASAVAKRWSGPLVLASWGFDLMRDVELDVAAAEQAMHALHRADAVLVDNDGPKSKAIAMGASPDAIVQFPWGVDQHEFRPDGDDLRAELGWASGELIIVTTRSHEQIYDVATVIAGFAQASAAHPDLRLLIAGSGSLTDELKTTARDAGVAERIRFIGNVDRIDLPRLYRTADVYVSASLVDGSSVSLLEAMACGVPVCVTRITGNRQWVSASTGFDFETGNAAELSERLLEVLDAENKSGVADRAQSALSLVRREADWSDAPRRLLELAQLAQRRNQVARTEWVRP